MTGIRSPIFTQYRSADKLYVFSSENEQMKMSVYDRDHQLLKTQILSRAILQSTPLGQSVLTRPSRSIIRHLLRYNYTPTTQPNSLFISPYYEVSSMYAEQAVHTLEGHSCAVQSFQVLPNGCLASGSLDKTIKIWDPSQGFKCIQTLQGHNHTVYSLQVLSNGCLASASCDKTIKIWDPSQGFKCIQTWQGHSDAVFSLQVLPNGCLASASHDNTIKIWDPKQGFKCIQTLTEHSNNVWSLQVLSNGCLASASHDNTIKIWDPNQGFKCIQTLQGHNSSVYSLQVLPNGCLASGSDDNTIKIWDPSQGFKCIQTLTGHGNYVWSLQVLPNGCLASASHDNTIKIWDPKQVLFLSPSVMTEELRSTIAKLQPSSIETKERGLQDSITRSTFQQPVITNCGHTFEKKTIEEYLLKHANDNKPCPVCRTSVRAIS